MAELKKKANRLPLTAGVYIMKDKSGKIIYIGKAKSLKNRVTQYFGSGNNHTEKVRQMVSNVNDFEYILCDSEFEALILENSLIKQNQPKYNILLKDDKGYHYIKITNDKWRKIVSSKTTDQKAQYIGPYNSGYIVNQTVDEVRKIFRLPDCNRSFDKPTKPCLNYHLGICDAPCRCKISLDDYNATVDEAVSFIKKGNSQKLTELLTKQMNRAAERLDFEQAAKLRDRINAINKLREKQKVVLIPYDSQDVFASVFLGEKASISVLVFRNKRLSDKQNFIIDGINDKKELYSQFLQQYYGDRQDIPQRIVLDENTENDAIIERWLTEKAGKKVSIIIPKIGEQLDIVKMCRNNAAESISKLSDTGGREMYALDELGRILGLSSIPRYIEAYDISNTAGSENVAGMVVFRDGRPYKKAYRLFKIKSFYGQDDYRSMAEVLDRRFLEYKKGEDESFSTLPDLILLDGGEGQISAVLPVLEKHNISVSLFGMVKDSKHRTRAIASSGGDIAIKSNRAAFTLVTSIQDEVHRYAITYHKKRRTKSMLASELLEIEGIGDTRRKALLKHFKTLTAIKNASIDELSSVKGMNRKSAEAIFNYYVEK
ncbi:MAG: excinuclease ABC subunit UvrC [Ruminococcaceae bacterium]|nr:excinuclease ABC subunit UvrC [Oscillospiraceae bacterium]